jgi:hypothetical protein
MRMRFATVHEPTPGNRAPAFRIPLARAKRKCHGYCTRAGFDPDPTLTVGLPWVSCWRAIAGERYPRCQAHP